MSMSTLITPATLTDSRAPVAPFHALILAGGRSRRMGRDKAMLSIDGRPLLHYQMALMRRLGASSVKVSGNYPDYQGVPDQRADLGPLGGLYSAWPSPDEQNWLVLPVDMPRVGGDQLYPLLAQLTTSPAACYQDHALPLALRLNTAVHRLIRQLVEDESSASQRSLKQLHSGAGGATLALPAGFAAALINCNTPAQWQQAQQ